MIYVLNRVYRQYADAWDGRPLGRIFREAAARVRASDGVE